MRSILYFASIYFASILSSCFAIGGDFETAVSSFLSDHCVDCHGLDEPSGSFSIEGLGHDLSNEEVARRWVRMYDRVAAGEMPPRDAIPPLSVDKKSFLAAVEKEVVAAEQSRNDVVLRRLNRREYQHTIQELFATDSEVHGLPEDNSTDGYDTVGEGLAVSAEAMQAYLDVADQVLDAVFGSAKKPKYIRHETNLLDQVDWKGRPQLDSQIGKMFRRTDDGLVIFQSNYCPTNLVNFARLRAPAGTYRGLIRVRAIQSDRPVTLRIYAGDTIVNRRERHLVGYYDIPPGEWTTVEFEDRLVEDGGTFLPKCYGTRDTRKNADSYGEPGLEIGDIVIEGPIEAWPPASRTRLFDGIDLEHANRDDALGILERIIPLAFRRPVDHREIDEYLSLFETALDRGRSFEQSIRVSLKAVLCSPEFLFLDEPQSKASDRISQFALASRLSYFLWSSMPDSTLLDLAERGELSDPVVLGRQVQRMLNSEKASAFRSSFVDQWLDLKEIDFTEPDATLYPEYDELLRLSMVQETALFFEEVLDKDLSLLSFVDSDFTFLNGRLAKHYGIEGVEGQLFRKVELPDNSVRGGILTHASVLKVTSNGTYTSPVIRGAWVLNRILGTPTPPPPDNVGSIEPDIRGATTIKEQLDLHRESSDCAVCHQRIDPPGLLLEAFDPIGGYRSRYRTTNDEGPRPDIRQAPFTFAWVRYRIGPEVDSTAVTADGTRVADIGEFKRYLLSKPDQIVRNLVRQLLTYSLGRRVSFSDRAAIEEIVRESKRSNDGFRSLIEQVVVHPVFQMP